MMNPGMRPEIPPFYQLDEYEFQDLCRDLFDAEPGIETCEVYGTRGQAQDGIDLLAYRKDGDGLEVGQCKRYRDFPPREIQKAADEFLAYWKERWSKKNVKRFILFVACDLSQRQRQDEIERQKERFKTIGIAFEPWSAAKIQNKLRPHPGIVARYCKPEDHWLKVICGIVQPTLSSTSSYEKQTSDIISSVLANQVSQLAVRVSGETERKLELMRNAWRDGRDDEAIKWLKELKADNTLWSVLSSEVKAKLLRFEASLELDMTGNVSQAKRLADEARTLAPADNAARLQALIAYIEGGPEAAIELLAGQKELDSLNLKAALLLEVGRVDESRSLLELEGTGVESNAETFRIRALLNLLARDLSQARLEIQKALELEPKWEVIRFTAAIIDYFSALSPAELPDHLVSWPEPVDWILVKRDDMSLTYLRAAEKVFRDLAERTRDKKEEHQRFEAWRLACLANDPERQEEAIKYCREILEADPTRYHVIAWVAARSFNIDLKPSQKALERLVANESASIHHIIALISCYFVSQRADKAIKLLEKTKLAFQKHHAEALWVAWYAQSLLVSGAPEAAIKTIESFGLVAELRYIRATALRALAKQTEDWQPLIRHLEISYEETEDPYFLLEYCKLMAQQENWSYVADRAEQLIEKLSTGEALRLAVIATYNAKRFDRCLGLLDNYRELFRERKLPGELRHIRVLCQRALGILPAAIAEAEALVHDEPTAKNLLALADLYVKKGDLKGLAIVARRLNAVPELNADQSLRVALLVQSEDRQLATSLWKKATSQDLPDEAVGTALALGYQLGLDQEVGPLLARMADLASKGQGGIKMATIEDFLSIAKQQREHGIKLDELYRNGTVPIHLIAGQLNRPLVDLYHRFPAEYESELDPARQFSLLVRHGGRTLAPGFPNNAPKWRLNLDITAILLAEHLEILADVEKVFAPLRIPEDLIPALIWMREKLSPQQPSRLRACQQIIDLAERGVLHVKDCSLPSTYGNDRLVHEQGENWVAFFENARTQGGYLVDYLPLKNRDLSGPSSALPEDAGQYLVNCRALVEALRQQGPLSEEEYGKALKALGEEGLKNATEVVPGNGALLYCFGSIPEILADANLLQVVCEHFRVQIEKREFDRIKAELQEHDRRHEIAEWLGNLRDRLGKGIDDGVYEIIPLSLKDDGIEEKISDELSFRCLLTLLRLEAKESDVIWVDDRCMNSYSYGGGAPIVGINEVLKALVGVGTLTVADYYDKITRLRAANLRFISIEKDEILHHLRQARVENGIVVETRELTILRRYVAACLLRSEVLQRPVMHEGAPNPNGEMAFLVGLGTAISDSLAEIWAAGEEDENICQARADWILANLYLEHLGLFNVTELTKLDKDDHYFVAVSLADLISTLKNRSNSHVNPICIPANYQSVMRLVLL